MKRAFVFFFYYSEGRFCLLPIAVPPWMWLCPANIVLFMLLCYLWISTSSCQKARLGTMDMKIDFLRGIKNKRRNEKDKQKIPSTFYKCNLCIFMNALASWTNISSKSTVVAKKSCQNKTNAFSYKDYYLKSNYRLRSTSTSCLGSEVKELQSLWIAASCSVHGVALLWRCWFAPQTRKPSLSVSSNSALRFPFQAFSEHYCEITRSRLQVGRR